MSDPQLIDELRGALASQRVLIADGHHRFEVALSRRRLFGGVLSYFCWAGDPALLLHPIHRIVEIPPAAHAAWQTQLAALCDLVPLPDRQALNRWLASAQGQGGFGYAQAAQVYGLRLRQEILADWLLHPTVPQPLADLDVVILHHVLLPRLGGGSTAPAVRAYTPDQAKALAMVEAQPGICAWLLRPLVLAQTFALAAQGMLLPPKSTYFYPKVLSGLCIHPAD